MYFKIGPKAFACGVNVEATNITLVANPHLDLTLEHFLFLWSLGIDVQELKRHHDLVGAGEDSLHHILEDLRSATRLLPYIEARVLVSLPFIGTTRGFGVFDPSHKIVRVGLEFKKSFGFGWLKEVAFSGMAIIKLEQGLRLQLSAAVELQSLFRSVDEGRSSFSAGCIADIDFNSPDPLVLSFYLNLTNVQICSFRNFISDERKWLKAGIPKFVFEQLMLRLSLHSNGTVEVRAKAVLDLKRNAEDCVYRQFEHVWFSKESEQLPPLEIVDLTDSVWKDYIDDLTDGNKGRKEDHTAWERLKAKVKAEVDWGSNELWELFFCERDKKLKARLNEEVHDGAEIQLRFVEVPAEPQEAGLPKPKKKYRVCAVSGDLAEDLQKTTKTGVVAQVLRERSLKDDRAAFCLVDESKEATRFSHAIMVEVGLSAAHHFFLKLKIDFLVFRDLVFFVPGLCILCGESFRFFDCLFGIQFLQGEMPDFQSVADAVKGSSSCWDAFEGMLHDPGALRAVKDTIQKIGGGRPLVRIACRLFYIGKFGQRFLLRGHFDAVIFVGLLQAGVESRVKLNSNLLAPLFSVDVDFVFSLHFGRKKNRFAIELKGCLQALGPCGLRAEIAAGIRLQKEDPGFWFLVKMRVFFVFVEFHLIFLQKGEKMSARLLFLFGIGAEKQSDEGSEELDVDYIAAKACEDGPVLDKVPRKEGSKIDGARIRKDVENRLCEKAEQINESLWEKICGFFPRLKARISTLRVFGFSLSGEVVLGEEECCLKLKAQLWFCNKEFSKEFEYRWIPGGEKLLKEPSEEVMNSLEEEMTQASARMWRQLPGKTEAEAADFLRSVEEKGRQYEASELGSTGAEGEHSSEPLRGDEDFYRDLLQTVGMMNLEASRTPWKSKVGRWADISSMERSCVVWMEKNGAGFQFLEVKFGKMAYSMNIPALVKEGNDVLVVFEDTIEGVKVWKDMGKTDVRRDEMRTLLHGNYQCVDYVSVSEKDKLAILHCMVLQKERALGFPKDCDVQILAHDLYVLDHVAGGLAERNAELFQKEYSKLEDGKKASLEKQWKLGEIIWYLFIFIYFFILFIYLCIFFFFFFSSR
jgi:hypothetical protein